jgi:hypothetical protein
VNAPARLLRSLGSITVVVSVAPLIACGGGGGSGSIAPVTAQSPAVFSTSIPRYTGTLSLAFPTWGSDVGPAVEAAIQPQDYIGIDVADGDPALVQVVGASHVFATGTDTDESSAPPYPPYSLQNAVQRCPSPGIMIYDIEHWLFTPQAQQIDPGGAIIQAMNEIGGFPTCPGSSSPKFLRGLAPDGIFNGTLNGSQECSFSITSPAAFYNETANGLTQGLPIGGTTWAPADFASIDIYHMQLQILMNDSPSNLCYGTPQNWVSGTQQLITLARAGNPNISIWAQVSLRDETAETIAQAVELAQTSSVHPNVYYVAYPRPLEADETPAPICPTPVPTPSPHSSATCTYQTPQNFQNELYYLGRSTPGPSSP